MNSQTLKRPSANLRDRSDLFRLSKLSGLSAVERAIVARMLAETSWSDGDRRCLKAMKERHLQP